MLQLYNTFPAAPFCNELMEELESNPVTRIVWNSVKPMLMGQLLYAPDSPAVRQIIKNVSTIGHLVDRFINVESGSVTMNTVNTIL